MHKSNLKSNFLLIIVNIYLLYIFLGSYLLASLHWHFNLRRTKTGAAMCWRSPPRVRCPEKDTSVRSTDMCPGSPGGMGIGGRVRVRCVEPSKGELDFWNWTLTNTLWPKVVVDRCVYFWMRFGVVHTLLFWKFLWSTVQRKRCRINTKFYIVSQNITYVPTKKRQNAENGWLIRK